MKHGKRLLIGMLLLTIFLMNVGASPASAFSYEGEHWYPGYARVSIDSSIPSGWTNSLTAAASAWTNAGSGFYFSWASSNNKLSYKSLGANGAVASTYPVFSDDQMLSCRVEFNSDKSWSTASNGEAGKIDVQSAATHEFGHWLRLRHSSYTEATMYEFIYPNDTKMRSLYSDDIAGIRFIYYYLR